MVKIQADKQGRMTKHHCGYPTIIGEGGNERYRTASATILKYEDHHF